MFQVPQLRGVCPHCQVAVCFLIDGERNQQEVFRDSDRLNVRGARVFTRVCPNCNGIVIDLIWWGTPVPFRPGEEAIQKQERIYPRSSVVRRPPPELPVGIAQDYLEAASVEELSPCAAAALLRRCLQAALRDRGFTHKSGKLESEIDAAAQDPRIDSSLKTKLTVVRRVGNYAAHPEDLLSVEPGEVDALFAALDEFFDRMYVAPVKEAKFLDELNKKLVAAGKKAI